MKILFFASIRERLESDGETWDQLEGCESVSDVLARLRARNSHWEDVLDPRNLLVSVNQEIARADHKLNPDDEIGIFPPVTGG
jgi:molybdopterin synthase sulfur carrier subunit